jgi:hypothetical protein
MKNEEITSGHYPGPITQPHEPLSGEEHPIPVQVTRPKPAKEPAPVREKTTYADDGSKTEEVKPARTQAAPVPDFAERLPGGHAVLKVGSVEARVDAFLAPFLPEIISPAEVEEALAHEKRMAEIQAVSFAHANDLVMKHWNENYRAYVETCSRLKEGQVKPALPQSQEELRHRYSKIRSEVGQQLTVYGRKYLTPLTAKVAARVIPILQKVADAEEKRERDFAEAVSIGYVPSGTLQVFRRKIHSLERFAKPEPNSVNSLRQLAAELGVEILPAK